MTGLSRMLVRTKAREGEDARALMFRLMARGEKK